MDSSPPTSADEGAQRHLVFVFGTLKEGFPNFHANRGQRVPGVFQTLECWPLYLVGVRCSPWLLDRRGAGMRVRGQLFSVDGVALARMDRLERTSEPDGYRRVTLQVVPSDQPGEARPCTAFAYLKAAQDMERETACVGPLDEYTPEHAARYRPRGTSPLPVDTARQIPTPTGTVRPQAPVDAQTLAAAPRPKPVLPRPES